VTFADVVCINNHSLDPLLLPCPVDRKVGRELRRIGRATVRAQFLATRVVGSCDRTSPARVARKLVRLADRLELAILGANRVLPKLCADQYQFNGGGLLERVTILRALAERLTTDASCTAVH
jgi:hypothetical protein